MALEIIAQRAFSLRGLEQVEGREVRKLVAVQEDERGLDPAVGQEQAARELRQLVSVLGHAETKITG